MAQAIALAIEDQGTLIAEAGTGTGKTFAYLVPALLWGGKVIVSTGTKTLQDQLFRKDLPTVRAALGAPVTVKPPLAVFLPVRIETDDSGRGWAMPRWTGW